MEQLQTIGLSFKCPKVLNELQPCNGGWYCNGCQKLVHDFRGKTEQEIQQAFAESNYKLCGMFEADRIQIATPLPKWRRWATAAMIAMGFTGLYHAGFAQEPIKIGSSATAKNNTAVSPGFLAGVMIEMNAEFPGGTEKLQKFIATHITANASCLPGQKAYVAFVIEKDGSLSDIKMLRSPFDEEMNARILQAFKRSPKWKPARQNGKVIRQQFTCPVAPMPKDVR